MNRDIHCHPTPVLLWHRNPVFLEYRSSVFLSIDTRSFLSVDTQSFGVSMLGLPWVSILSLYWPSRPGVFRVSILALLGHWDAASILHRDAILIWPLVYGLDAVVGTRSFLVERAQCCFGDWVCAWFGGWSDVWVPLKAACFEKRKCEKEFFE